MTYDPQNNSSKAIQMADPAAETRLQQIEAATEFAKSLKDIAPLVTDFITLVNNLANHRFEGEKQLLAGQDARHRREILGNLLDRQLERLSRTQDKLIDQLGKYNGAEKDRYVELVLKSMDNITEVTERMIQNI